MLKRFLLSVIRNIKKDIYQSVLNIIGLTLGLTAVIYISTYIYNEATFDSFHSKADRIYRVVATAKAGGTENNMTGSENPMAKAAKNEFPEVEESTRIYLLHNQLVQTNENKFIEEHLWYADDNILSVFDFPLLKGNQKQALSEPNSIVVTKSFANKYFGESSPIGKSINIGSSNTPYTVTGILKDIPKNSHLRFEALASFNSLPLYKKDGDLEWGNFRDLYTYILLKPKTNIKTFEEKFKIFPYKHYETRLKAAGISLDQFLSHGNPVEYSLQKITSIHLDNSFVDNIMVYGNRQLLYILGAIGILILFVACFNFINLTTARASLKAKEIGIKKVMGSSKSVIIIHIISEILAISLLALFSSFILLCIVLPILNSITGLSYSLNDFFSFPLILILISLPFLIAAIAGVLPAFIISRYNPIEVLKGKLKNTSQHNLLKNVFVALQFVVFIMLIIGTIVIKKQLNYLRNHNPGYNKENVLVIKNCNKLKQSAFVLKNELVEKPEIIRASYTDEVPSKSKDLSNLFCKPGDENKVIINRIFTDEDFLQTLKIKLKDGHFFSEGNNEIQNSAIINSKAAKLLGWTDCIGKTIYDYNEGETYNIIGIVEDFHMGSLKYEQEPYIIRKTGYADNLVIRIRPGTARQIVNFAENKWEALNKDVPFEYYFLNNSFNAQYKSEEQLGKLVGLFSLVSVIIACLGLVGVVSFATLRRQKEIGVRKVNGAKISEVLILLNKAYISWILLAFTTAVPLASYAMHKWLENFALKTTISWWIYAISGIMALCFALLTVSWQSWKAATANPAQALRDE